MSRSLTTRGSAFVPIVPDRRKYYDSQQSLVNRFEKAWEVRRRELEDDMRKLEQQFIELNPVDEGGSNPASPTSKHAHLGLGEQLQEPHVIRDPASGSRICRATFDVRDFEPEDIRVTTEGNSLIVQGVQKVTSSGRGAVNVIKKDFVRKVTLPMDANRSQLQARLSADGILTVQTPMFHASAVTAAESYGTIQRHNKPRPPVAKHDNNYNKTLINTYGTLPKKKSDQALIKGRNIKVPPQQVEQGRSIIKVPKSPGRQRRSVPASPVQQQQSSSYKVYPSYQSAPNTPTGTTRKKLKLAVDLGCGFMPNDIVVKNIIPENKFVVEANRMTSNSLDEPTRYVKAYRWPVQVDPETICAILKGDGRLTITAYPMQDFTQPTVLWR